jgi:hypothetical protein
MLMGLKEPPDGQLVAVRNSFKVGDKSMGQRLWTTPKSFPWSTEEQLGDSSRLMTKITVRLNDGDEVVIELVRTLAHDERKAMASLMTESPANGVLALRDRDGSEWLLMVREITYIVFDAAGS